MLCAHQPYWWFIVLLVVVFVGWHVAFQDKKLKRRNQ